MRQCEEIHVERTIDILLAGRDPFTLNHYQKDLLRRAEEFLYRRRDFLPERREVIGDSVPITLGTIDNSRLLDSAQIHKIEKTQLWETRYDIGQGRLSTTLWAFDEREAREMCCKRGMGEEILGPTRNYGRHVAPSTLLENGYLAASNHAMSWLGMIALHGRLVPIADVLGDAGIIHEMAHTMHGLTEQGISMRTGLVQESILVPQSIYRDSSVSDHDPRNSIFHLFRWWHTHYRDIVNQLILRTRKIEAAVPGMCPRERIRRNNHSYEQLILLGAGPRP